MIGHRPDAACYIVFEERHVHAHGVSGYSSSVNGAVFGARENTVRRDDVEVHEAAERGVEPLHEGDASRLRATNARGLFTRARDLFDEDAIARR